MAMVGMASHKVLHFYKYCYLKEYKNNINDLLNFRYFSEYLLKCLSQSLMQQTIISVISFLILRGKMSWTLHVKQMIQTAYQALLYFKRAGL